MFNKKIYSVLFFFYLKEQEKAKKGGKKKENGSKEQQTVKKGGKKKEKEGAVQETVAVQNISPSISLPMEEMSEQYMAINTFSQILTVIFQTITPFY